MNTQLISTELTRKQKTVFVTAVLISLMIATMLLDKLEANFKGTGFYLSESFMFSSFWWLVMPIGFIQFHFAKRQRVGWFSCAALMLLPIVIHLFLYPALVWIISACFYYHTFRYWRTFNYGLTMYLLKLIILYIVPVALYLFFRTKIDKAEKPGTNTIKQQSFLQTFIVTDINKHVTIQATDILYISANYPYVNLHDVNRKFLYNSTLKSVADKLDPDQFIRIHKSLVVNIACVKSYQSRNNGDYDIVLTDGSALRVSRNYAPGFKSRINATKHVTSN